MPSSCTSKPAGALKAVSLQGSSRGAVGDHGSDRVHHDPGIRAAGHRTVACVIETTDAVMENSICFRWENKTGTVSEAMDSLTLITGIITILFPLVMVPIARLITANRRRLGVFREVEVLLEEAMEEVRNPVQI